MIGRMLDPLVSRSRNLDIPPDGELVVLVRERRQIRNKIRANFLSFYESRSTFAGIGLRTAADCRV